MKNRTLIVAALVMVLLCVGLIFLGLRHENADGGSPGQSQTTDGQTADGDTQSQAQQDITATLAVCGDIMSHLPQTNDAYDAATDTYSYLPCFQYAKAWTESADYTVGNLETTLNGPPYSGYPQFCAPDALAYNLNHAVVFVKLRLGAVGADVLELGLVQHVQGPGQAVVALVHAVVVGGGHEIKADAFQADVGGISVAFLGYTYGTNGIPVAADKDFSLNRFNVDYTGDCVTLDQEKLSSELAYAESLNTDLIAVMIHWGIEYQTTQNAYQEQVADFLISHGADVILGSHSHVPQPMGTRTVTLDDGSTRTGFVAYSLGNFVSNQSPATVNVNYTDTTAILRLELTKNGQTQETTVTDVSYVPMLVLNRGTGVQDQYLILDVNALIAAHDSGDTSVATDAVYSKLEYALNGCHTILGADYDKAGTPPQTTSA